MAGSDDRVPLLEASANNRGPGSLRSISPTLVSVLQEIQTKSSERPTGFYGETFNSSSAHGQHTNNGVEEEMPEPGRRHMRGKRSVAQTGGKPPQDKRKRAQNWADDEKTSLLMDKLGFLVMCILRDLGVSTFKYDKRWAYYVSERIGRNRKSCQQQWDSLLKYRNAVCDHESKSISGSHVSYWHLTEPQKDDVNKGRRGDDLQELPRGFKREWCEIIAFIYQIQDAAKKIPSWMQIFQKSSGKMEANLPSSSTAHLASTITGSDNSPGGPLDATRSQPSSSQEVQESMDSPLPLASDQDYHRAKDDVLQGEFHDDLISMIAPYVNKAIREALKPLWDSVLRSQEGAEPKDHKLWLDIVEQELSSLKSDTLTPEREKLAFQREKVAFEREKLALEREKIQLKYQGASTFVANINGVGLTGHGPEPNHGQMDINQVQLTSRGASTSLANSSYRVGSNMMPVPSLTGHGLEPKHGQMDINQDFPILPYEFPFRQDFSSSWDELTSFQ